MEATWPWDRINILELFLPIHLENYLAKGLASGKLLFNMIAETWMSVFWPCSDSSTSWSLYSSWDTFLSLQTVDERLSRTRESQRSSLWWCHCVLCRWCPSALAPLPNICKKHTLLVWVSMTNMLNEGLSVCPGAGNHQLRIRLFEFTSVSTYGKHFHLPAVAKCRNLRSSRS